MKKEIIIKNASKSITVKDATITLSAKAYLYVNKKFADLTNVTAIEVITSLNIYFKNFN